MSKLKVDLLHQQKGNEAVREYESLMESYRAVVQKISTVLQDDNGGEGTDITITYEWKEFIQQCVRSYLRTPKLQAALRGMVEGKINVIVESVVAEELDALAAEIVEKSKAGLRERFEAQVEAALAEEIKKAVSKVKAGLFR